MQRVTVIALFASSLATVAGCTLLFPYADPAPEVSDAQCHDGRDNDDDGAIDCDDVSCLRCVTSPNITCPDGWTSREIESGGSAGRTCDPPAAIFDDCPSEAPAGSAVVEASAGALRAALAAAPPPSGDSPPFVLWLAPGLHVEGAGPDGRPLLLFGNVVLFGLCSGSEHPVLVPGDGTGAPFRTDEILPSSIEIDHIEIQVASVDLTWSGAFVFSHTQIVPYAGTPSVIRFRGATGASLRVERSSLEVPIGGLGARITALDSRLRSVSANDSVVSLERTRLAGDLTVSGALASLVADSLFLDCGRIALDGGASGVVRSSVIVENEAAGSPIGASGLPGLRASVTLEDVLMLSDAGCPSPSVTGPSTFFATDVAFGRVVLSSAFGLALTGHSTADLRDTALVLGEPGSGVSVDTSSLLVERLAISGPTTTAVRVRGTTRGEASVMARHLYVNRIGSGGTELTTPARGPCDRLAGGIALDGTLGPAVGSLDESSISGVRGCGIYLEGDAALTSTSTRVERSWIGVCAPGRADEATLRDGLELENNEEDVSTLASLCVDVGVPSCSLPSECPGANEVGLCTNGLDDDTDGLVDCVDRIDCDHEPACIAELCADGLDNDADGLVDCADELDCGPPDCPATMIELCDDGLDNDVDGATDCDDTQCYGFPACDESSVCEDGLDNDSDGVSDCADPDCACDLSCGSAEPCTTADLGSVFGREVVTGSISGHSCISALRAACSCSFPMGPVVSFRWTAPATGIYLFETVDPAGAAAPYDTVLEVFGDCDGFSHYGCHDDPRPGMLLANVTTDLTAGETVVVVIYARDRSAVGDYALAITQL